MKIFFRQGALALLVLSLAGCGLKGPLYFPPEQPAPAKKTQQQNTQTPQASSVRQ
ncbi:LPS translocon maturation chaperone LptM [Dickeya poaceiphila]|nr:lipoprotein [Dickeya poaceiphila]